MTAYRVVKPPTRLDFGPRPGAPLAFAWHMAEGCNVARYLAGDPARGVSVNFTIECDGEIVQMVPPDHWAGSINPRTLRTTDDPDGFYGASAARAVLGDKARDPNRWVLAVEIGGRAVNGPNELQHAAMARLAADMRARYPGLRGNLGHRDFQNVKPCPGRLVRWERFGGHGLYQPEEEVDIVATAIVFGEVKPEKPWVVDVPEGTVLYSDSTGTRLVAERAGGATRTYYGNPHGATEFGIVAVKTARLTGRNEWIGALVKDEDVPAPRPAELEPEPDLSTVRSALDSAAASIDQAKEALA